MRRKTLSLILLVLFATSMMATAYAASTTCTVTAIDGATVTLDCGKDAGELETGATVKVKAARKKAVEGC